MIQHKLAKSFITIAVTLLAGTNAAFGQISFERVAPENSIVVVHVHDATTTEARLKKTALHDLWRSDEMREMREKWSAEIEEGFEEALQEAGIEREDLGWPTGTIGFALFPVIDPEIGMPSPAFVLLADYGERADAMERAINALLEHGRGENEIELDEREILGRTVRSVTFVQGDVDWEMDDDDDWGFNHMGMRGIGAGGAAGPDDSFRELHLVREGGNFILCNDLGSITEILDGLDNNQASGLTDRVDFQAAVDQLGSNDAYAVLLTRDLMQLVQGVDPTGMAMMLPPMLRSLFGEIGALSTSVLLDAPDAMIRQNVGVYMPRGKGGLTALMDVSTPRGALPSFVGPDAYSYSSINFNFRGLPDAAQRFVQANPMLQMWGAGEQLAAIDPILRQMTGTLGSTVHLFSTLTRPIGADSASSVVAIESSDTQQFETLFAEMAAGMGMEGRDFLGHRIYSSGPMMMPGGMGGMGMPEISVGIGAGHIFAGQTLGVEQALRAAAEPDRVAGLAEDAEYRRAVSLIPETPLVSWGYSDIVTTIEATLKVAQAANEQMMEEMREQFPEWAEEMDEEDDDPFAALDFDLLRRYIGPSVTWMRSTDNGFVGTTLLLAADEQD